jgi:exodeoxyribonuclease VII small subunit
MSEEKKPSGEEIRFGQAIDELEEILHRVEAEEIDIDELAAELKKATDLLEICRNKIRKAELEVTQIVQSLEETDGSEDEAHEDD